MRSFPHIARVEDWEAARVRGEYADGAGGFPHVYSPIPVGSVTAPRPAP